MKRSILAQAATFAEDARHGYATARETRAAIVAKFTAILAKRSELETEAEALARELAERPTPWADFRGNPTPAQVEELSRQRKVEGQEAAAKIAETITALDTLFSAVCSALDWEGLTLTAKEIGAIKRLKPPKDLAAALDTLKERPTIPAGERLGAEDAATLYHELTRQGFISGDIEAFRYYFGKLSKPKPKAPEKPLKWLADDMPLAVFAWDFTKITQPQGQRVNETAILAAFGRKPDKNGNFRKYGSSPNFRG